MCSTKPKLPSTSTIGTKYIIQLDKNISLVDFESAQNIFFKITNLWEEYDSEKIKFWIFELLRQLVKSAKISIYLQVTPKFKRKKNFDNDENRTGNSRSFVSPIVCMPGVQRGWPITAQLSDKMASMPW